MIRRSENDANKRCLDLAFVASFQDGDCSVHRARSLSDIFQLVRGINIVGRIKLPTSSFERGDKPEEKTKPLCLLSCAVKKLTPVMFTSGRLRLLTNLICNGATAICENYRDNSARGFRRE